MEMDVAGVKVFVCPVRGRAAEIAGLRRQVAALGAVLVCADSQTLNDYETCVAEADAVVILLCPESVNDPDVKDVVDTASRAGKRIIIVWLEGCGLMDLPPFLAREGDAAVRQDGDGLERAIVQGEPVWEMPDGSRRPDQKVPRHKC